MATPADIETLRTAVNTAIDADNFASAKKAFAKYLIAKADLPDVDMGGARVTYRDDSEWIKAVQRYLDAGERAANASSRGVFQVTKIRGQRISGST